MQPTTRPCVVGSRTGHGKDMLCLLPRRDHHIRGVKGAAEETHNSNLSVGPQWRRVSIRCRLCARGDLVNASMPKDFVVVHCSQQTAESESSGLGTSHNNPSPLQFESVVAREGDTWRLM